MEASTQRSGNPTFGIDRSDGKQLASPSSPVTHQEQLAEVIYECCDAAALFACSLDCGWSDFIVAVYPLMMAWWPSGWRWQPNQPEYEQMILGVYATLGVFLLIASRNPLQHRSLIWFTVWSSLVHAGIMAVQAINAPAEHGHLLGDVPALIIVAVLLAVLTPRGVVAEKA
jgi:hypothetical protein